MLLFSQLAPLPSNPLDTRRMHEGSITIRLPADVKEIERLNWLVRKFGELHEIPPRIVYAVNLALDEIVSNIVLHGCEDCAGEEVVVRIETAGCDLRSEIVDGGRAFNPLECRAPELNAPLAEREVGGLGVHLARKLMDRTEYRREGAKNVLTMRKRIR
jgi:anti-sigma regulatory factor (Ser/Thr protein kinase)